MTTAGSGRRGWRRVTAGTVLTLATILGGTPTAVPVAAAAQLASTCRTATGPFTVHGTQVLDHDGQPFVSYGITVPGLQGPNWASSGQLDQEKIAATPQDWCANTVRLQLTRTT